MSVHQAAKMPYGMAVLDATLAHLIAADFTVLYARHQVPATQPMFQPVLTPKKRILNHSEHPNCKAKERHGKVSSPHSQFKSSVLHNSHGSTRIRWHDPMVKHRAGEHASARGQYGRYGIYLRLPGVGEGLIIWKVA